MATPLGNLEDITLRALRILAEVDFIAAEDTRHTLKLLNHFQIKKSLISCFQHNERERTAELIQKILSGQNVALVSDAGMPGISDPGSHLVSEAISHGITVTPIPGPTAVITALAASGLTTESFRFEGFLPRKDKEQRERLQTMAGFGGTLVFYESPYRVFETLKNIHQILGERRVVLARELTKVHEEFIRGNLSDIITKMAGMEKPKGEFTILIAGCQENTDTSAAYALSLDEPVSFTELNTNSELLNSSGGSASLRAELRAIAKKSGKKTKEIYQLYLADQAKKK